MELLSPAGDFNKLKMAINYGADAVYFSGKNYGLRAFAGNFDLQGIQQAVEYTHKYNKKAYVTLNIIAKDCDFNGLADYLHFLVKIQVDAVIVADIGIIRYIRRTEPTLNIHVSTQANVTNSESANFFADMGVTRIVLARELSLNEIREIRKNLNSKVELECFVHGAMCISYSGRCLLSNYLANRPSNRGECVQACRWEYSITEKSRSGERYDIQEDDRGTYILNSKDLNMISHLKELENAGVVSLKIEGRMKSEYYVACVTNAYRRAMDKMNGKKESTDFESELKKASHRKYTTGFYFDSNDKECLESSYPVQESQFLAVVLEDSENGITKVEQRNRFAKGDIVEILSTDNNFNKKITIEDMTDILNQPVEDAKVVQQILFLKLNAKLKKYDILRK